MGKKAKFVEDGYIQKVEWYLYNGKNILDLYVDDVKEEEYDIEWLESQLLKGEEYKQEEDYPKFVFTSFGRLFNVKSKRQLKVVITSRNVHLNSTEFRYTSNKVFKDLDWPHNIETILRRYQDNNWNHSTL